MSLDENWFTEIHQADGSAFSLRHKGLLHSEQSDFQKIEVFDTERFGKLMVIDGCTMVSSLDNFIYHEMMTHPALFTHPHPRRVAIIGGGDCGSLREVLKHPGVEKATQIDIDERVTRVSEMFFPELCEGNADPRAELLFIDGIKWMRDAEPDSLDVVIVDSTDPIGPGEVLFTPEFYAACRRALGEQGILVQQSESPLLHQEILKKMYADAKQAGFNELRTLFFPLVIYPSGWWSGTMMRAGGDLAAFREQDAKSDLGNRYYNAQIHRAALAEPEFFRQLRDAWDQRADG